ncbi:BA14K family protein [Roseibium sp. RKSG952]|uniref:BA14K family protein n=1 Tax=Roseibium sp. RKSG952 TaxID=2529384 RepID=UPI0012BC78A5|nr:BA14K family protein [Roseibium sp. RKSG952]MTH96791.1 BA14K family protein [Roseibium sp. RKSG952]
MTPTMKRIFAVALSGALLLPAVQAAEAGPRDGPREGWYYYEGPHKPNKHRRHNKHHNKRKNNDVGAAVAAGVIGLAAGAIIAGAASKPAYAAPPATAYYPPAPAPAPGYVQGPAGYQPWSPAWYQYCSSKYRSFNPNTGTYTTYRGVQRFCQ